MLRENNFHCVSGYRNISDSFLCCHTVSVDSTRKKLSDEKNTYLLLIVLN